MWMTVIVLLIFGLIFMLFELFVPGGILGIIGAGLMGYAVYMSFLHYGAVHGFGVLIFCGTATVILIYFGIKILPKTYIGKKIILSDSVNKQSGYHAESFNAAQLVGKEGVAESALRPAGIAAIGDQRLDVVTDGEFIDAQRRIKVIKVDGNRVVVETV